jgi:Cdc6-like AAA superfamily ATPase
MGHHRVAFAPYTSDQIREVIAERLRNCKIFTKDAISYASKKLSHFSSDIRTILSILRLAIEQHKEQSETKQIGIEKISKIWSEKYAKKSYQNDLPPVYIRIL